jgi:hypothetical protein
MTFYIGSILFSFLILIPFALCEYEIKKDGFRRKIKLHDVESLKSLTSSDFFTLVIIPLIPYVNIFISIGIFFTFLIDFIKGKTL